MPVRDFDDQRGFVMELHIVNDSREFSAEFLGQEDDPDLFVGDGLFQGIL